MYTSILYKGFRAHLRQIYRNVQTDEGREAAGGSMTIEESMVQQYGPLLNITQLAAILDRSPDGLRITLRSSGEWVNRINSTRLQLGRRVYFRTSEVAAVLAAR